MKKSLFLILGFVIAILASCEYKYIDPIDVIMPDGPVSYANDVQPIFEDKCVSCHASTSPILTDGTSFSNLIDGGYIDTQDPESSSLYQKVYGGHPAGSSLTASEKGIILQWITDGAQND